MIPVFWGCLGQAITSGHCCTWLDGGQWQDERSSSRSTQAGHRSFLFTFGLWWTSWSSSSSCQVSKLCLMEPDRRFSIYFQVFCAFPSIGVLYICHLAAKSGIMICLTLKVTELGFLWVFLLCFFFFFFLNEHIFQLNLSLFILIKRWLPYLTFLKKSKMKNLVQLFLEMFNLNVSSTRTAFYYISTEWYFFKKR